MSVSADPKGLFETHHETYDRFISAVGYGYGLRRFLMGWPALGRAQRILDAGCGTGVVSLALHAALLRRGLATQVFHAFDLTPAMLESFRRHLASRRVDGIELAEADVLQLDQLPPSWSGYDLIVSAGMLEYVPWDRLVHALAGLRGHLDAEGRFLLFITKRNWLTRPLVGRWWASNLYSADEIEQALRRAGFSTVRFRRFPPTAWHLALWGHVVEAEG